MKPTAEQEAVIAHREGPALILATAGSAKSTTMILWAKNLIESGVASPQSVLITTFSRLGVSDLRKRSAELGLTRLPDIRTLHSLAWKAIMAKHPKWKLPPGWWVRQIMKDVFDRCVDDAAQSYTKDDAGNWHDDRSGEVAGVKCTLKSVMQLISTAKASLILPDAWTDTQGYRYPSFVEWAKATYVEASAISVSDQCYRAYEAARRQPCGGKSTPKDFRPGNVACDHDDALLEVAKAIATGAEWVKSIEGSFGYVVVDECQDLNLAQWILVRHVARTFRRVSNTDVSTWQNLIVVGDDCQAIFEWRGARPDLLRDMMLRDGPSLSFYPLTTNFRSGQAILDVANRLLGTLKDRLFSGMLRCGRPDIEAEIITFSAGSATVEATAVVDGIQKSLREGRSPSEIAVLYRINAQSGLIEMELIRRGVPYRVAGRCFFMRPEIDAAIKYIALAMNEEDEEAFETIYRMPFRFIGRGMLKEFPTLASLRTPPKGQLAARFKGAPRLLRDMDGLILSLESTGLIGALEHVFDEIGVRRYCKSQADEDEVATAQSSQVDTAIEELLACAKIAGDPVKFIEYVRDQREKVMIEDGDGEKTDDRVTLSTCHRVKGLQFEEVFVVGVSAGLFPFKGAPPDEEKRLGYVAATRAKKVLRISWTETPSSIVYDGGLLERPRDRIGALDDIVRSEI